MASYNVSVQLCLFCYLMRAYSAENVCWSFCGYELHISIIIIIIIIIIWMSLVTGLFFLALLLNQRWSPPLRLQASHCSIFCIMCDVPSVTVSCSESIECVPGTASKFFLKLLVTIPVASFITVIIIIIYIYIYICVLSHLVWLKEKHLVAWLLYICI